LRNNHTICQQTRWLPTTDHPKIETLSDSRKNPNLHPDKPKLHPKNENRGKRESKINQHNLPANHSKNRENQKISQIGHQSSTHSVLACWMSASRTLSESLNDFLIDARTITSTNHPIIPNQKTLISLLHSQNPNLSLSRQTLARFPFSHPLFVAFEEEANEDDCSK